MAQRQNSSMLGVAGSTSISVPATHPAQNSPSERLLPDGHVRVLDGVRGIAILMVLLRHFYVEDRINHAYPLFGPVLTKFALAGNYGVQLFFVLSGFLITNILLRSKDSPHYLRNFYARRFLRIFPLYYGTLLLLLVGLPLVIPFDAAALSICDRQIWLWSYLVNAPWSGGGWDDSDLFRLGHFWSLCVEEHFYVIWFFRDFRVKKDWPQSTSGGGKARQSGGFWSEPPGPRAGGSPPAPAPFTSLRMLWPRCPSLPQIGPIGGPSRAVGQNAAMAEVDLGQ